MKTSRLEIELASRGDSSCYSLKYGKELIRKYYKKFDFIKLLEENYKKIDIDFFDYLCGDDNVPIAHIIAELIYDITKVKKSPWYFNFSIEDLWNLIERHNVFTKFHKYLFYSHDFLVIFKEKIFNENFLEKYFYQNNNLALSYMEWCNILRYCTDSKMTKLFEFLIDYGIIHGYIKETELDYITCPSVFTIVACLREEFYWKYQWLFDFAMRIDEDDFSFCRCYGLDKKFKEWSSDFKLYIKLLKGIDLEEEMN